MTHEIKIWLVHYHRVVEGTKTFELRNNDRAYQKGDIVVLRPFDNEEQRYALEYEPIKKMIGDVYPLDDNRVVFSLMSYAELP